MNATPLYSAGSERIRLERIRQMKDEGWTPEHDDEHTGGELALAAAAYAAHSYEKRTLMLFEEHYPGSFSLTDAWPEDWGDEWDKRRIHSRMRQLEIAGALIAAEIDRLLRPEK